MSEDESKQFVQVKAPVTGWEFLIKIWWLLIIGIAVVFYLLLKDQVPISWQYGYWTFVAVFFLTYWRLGVPEGWGLDTTKIDEGHIGLIPLNKFQLENIMSKPKMMMMMSESGPVALIGHKLISLNEKGGPTIHPLVELQTNSEVARRVARSQALMIDEYLVLKSVPEVESSRQFMEMHQAWRKKARLDPELSDTESKPESAD